jgi:hypothetical protein
VVAEAGVEGVLDEPPIRQVERRQKLTSTFQSSAVRVGSAGCSSLIGGMAAS